MTERPARTIRRPLLPLWLALIVAAAGGAILDLAYPSVGWWPLAFVGVASSLVTLIGRSLGGAIAVGLVFGASFYLIHIIWITRYLGPVPWFALAGLETLLSGLGAIAITLAYRWLPRAFTGRVAALWALPAVVAGLWTARELFLGSWPYTGFPWGRIGMSQAEGPLAELASWTGVSGLTFMVVFTAAAAIQAFREGQLRRVRTYVPAVATLAVLVLTPQFPTTDAGTMRVGAVQGNGPAGYFDDRPAWGVFQSQLDATAPLLNEDVDVLVWPEGSIDGDPTQIPSAAASLERLSARINAPVLVNAATTRDENMYNSSMVWTPEGMTAVHDKRNPVPMGEYVPDRWFYEAIAPDLIGLIQREYTPGSNSPVVELGDIAAGLAICFDVIYDSVIWEGAREGAEVFVFQTNNADFRGTDENLQQLAFARMRAIETGRSVVNISTVGTSQIIAPDGSVIDSLPENVAGAMVQEVPLRTGLTPAVLLGGSLNIALVVASLGTLIFCGVFSRRQGTRKTPAP